MKKFLLFALVLSGCGLIAWPGKACRKHDDCGGLKDGYCSFAEICTRECDADRPCPEDSVCLPQTRRPGVCLQQCEKDTECQTNFFCNEGTCQLKDPFARPPP